MNSTPPKVIYMVISILGMITFIGMASLCLTMFYKNYADPAVLTSIISITSAALGSLGTMLVSTRSQPTGGSTTATITTTSAPRPPTEPQQVVVTNPTDNPVKTEEQKP